MLALAGIVNQAQAQAPARPSLPTAAATEAPTDYLQITTDTAETWSDGTTQIVSITTPVTIQTDRAKISAKSAVIWFSAVEGSVLKRQRAEIALIGDATIEQGAVSRSGERLFVSTIVGGPIRLTIENRKINDSRDSDLFKSAAEMRPIFSHSARQVDQVLIQRPWIESSETQATTQPMVGFVAPKAPIRFFFKDAQTTTATPDGNIAAVLKGDVTLVQNRPNGDTIILQAQQAVVFTTTKDFSSIKTGAITSLQDAVTSAYLEGDVRINFTPAPDRKAGGQSEQRLLAEKVYYDFGTDQAVLTDVVLESSDPRVPFPITMRAKTMKQLALGEFKTEDGVLTTSQFATPSYSVNSTKAYIRLHDKNDGFGTRADFSADNATYRISGVPVFYLPKAAGSVSENGFPLRNLTFGGERSFGASIQTEWGLFESLGQLPPEGVDASLKLDYYADRGPGIGLDGSYKGGFVTDVTRQGWNFQGDFTSYLVIDDGQDRLGRERIRVPHEDEVRGRIQWEHQHFFPDNWQLQLRAGYTSDPTFLEEWFERSFDDGLPTNLSAYAKRQKDTEALTFLMEYQPSGFVTTADALQERFPNTGTNGSLDNHPYEIDRLPEVGYYRIGDSINDDSMTFFSENRLGGLHMNESDDSLIDYGFQFTNSTDRYSYPGIPSAGYTGVLDDYVIRGDFRQEIDYPVTYGEYRVVPYVVGRLTGYSDSPSGDAKNRILAGVGTRITTSFWNINDRAESKFWDIHRVRHIVEPELHLFASVSSEDREDLFIYDETIDGVSDVAAANFMIRQRWQTKRGGPGRWRNVDFFTLDTGIIGFANTPDEPINPDRAAVDDNRRGPLTAKGFRGLFFQSEPEASIARSSILANSQWRISDSTIMLSDISWNIEEQSLATVSTGILVGRGDRLTYYTGIRYIGELDSTIASFTSTYQISAKYTATFSAAMDLSKTDSRGGSFNIIRKSDRYSFGVGAYYDAVEDTSGLQFSFYPEGFGSGANSSQLGQFMGR